MKQPRWIERFNTGYDFLERIAKLLLFSLAILLVVWKWRTIDWSGTASDIINNYAPIKVQDLQNPTERPHETPGPPVDYLSIYQFGQLVFSTDKPYEIHGDTIIFDRLLLKGRPDYSQPFVYAGTEIKIVRINEYIGVL